MLRDRKKAPVTSCAADDWMPLQMPNARVASLQRPVFERGGDGEDF
jgi:hypothetical protein